MQINDDICNEWRILKNIFNYLIYNCSQVLLVERSIKQIDIFVERSR